MEDLDSTLIGEGGPRRPAGPVAFERGAVLGRYVVLAQLGSGGMGVVYSAFDPQLDRKVALKVLHTFEGDGTKENSGRPRLLREAQALAKLSHPNVIPIHDVGTVEGSVFIAMEFVDGQTLSDWCETERPWRERVAMLAAAGRGIAAAHRAGIVHRDFKPDNVMIGPDGRPRVLDFGLARAVGHDLEEEEEEESPKIHAEPSHDIPLTFENTLEAKLTLTGSIMGTPAYMAPEQYLARTVDERSDQFAFCVSLYEALYGQRPFRGENVAALAFQVCQGIIREPPKGSPVPTWLRKILTRGLSVEADDRYPSMDALLRELGRDPVRKRRRVLLGVAALALLAGSGVLAQRLLTPPQLCTGADEHLVGVWDAASREAVHAAFVASEVVYTEDAFRGVSEVLDAYTSEWTAMRTEACAATRIRGEQSDEVLTLRMACLDRGLGQLRSLTEVYANADAETVERALDASESLLPLRLCADVESLRVGVRPPETEALREQVEALRADLDRARAYKSAGQTTKARELLIELREPTEATGYRPLIAEVELAYGPTLDHLEDQPSVLERAVWMAEASHHDRVAAEAWIALALARGTLADSIEDALSAVARADAAIERLGGDDELRIRLEVAHGNVFLKTGRPEQAVDLLARAYQAREQAGQGGSPQALYEVVSLSNAMIEVGQKDEAAKLLIEALTLARASLGEDHPWVARIQTSLARAHYTRGEFEAAEAALRSGLAVFERAYGKDSTNVAAALNGLALILHHRGRLDEALEIYERALTNVHSNFGPQHANVAKILHNIGNLEREIGHNEASLAHLEACVSILRESYGPEHLQVAFATDNLGDTLLALGRHEQARVVFEQAIAAFEANGETSEQWLLYPLSGRAMAELGLDQPKQARASLERADALITKYGDELEFRTVGRYCFAFAQLLWGEGDRARARELAADSIAKFREGTSSNEDADAREVEAWLDERASE